MCTYKPYITLAKGILRLAWADSLVVAIITRKSNKKGVSYVYICFKQTQQAINAL